MRQIARDRDITVWLIQNQMYRTNWRSRGEFGAGKAFNVDLEDWKGAADQDESI